MATLPPSPINEFSDDTIEKKIYNMVNSFEEFIPVINDRNRLSFALLNYLKGEGDPPNITIRNNKLILKNITKEELAKRIEVKLEELKK